MAVKKKKAPIKAPKHKPVVPEETIIVSKGAAYSTTPVVKPKAPRPPDPPPVAVDPAILKKYGNIRPSRLLNTEWRQQHGIDPTDSIEDL